MADAQTGQDELEVSAGDKKLRIRGSDVLGLINMLCLGIALYGGYDHVQAGKESQKAIAEAIKDTNQTNVHLVRAMQEANCLNRLTPEQKKRFEEVDFCRKVGQGKAF